MIPLARQSILRAARSQFYPSSTSSLFRSQQLSALSRLLSTLAVLEQRDGKIQGASLSAIAAATKLGGAVTAFVAGAGAKAGAAAEAAKIKGLDKVLVVDNAAYDKVRPAYISV
ncbi:Electron transfer flavoprotein alpha-subunit [Coccidioides immitis]|nr:Electron transfer flavoprotein alpha-subunit [Coccidioides immitis]